MPAARNGQLWTKGTWTEGIKALSTVRINKSASAPHPAPGVCVIDSKSSYLLRLRKARATEIESILWVDWGQMGMGLGGIGCWRETEGEHGERQLESERHLGEWCGKPAQWKLPE